MWWLDDPARLPNRARQAVEQAAAEHAVHVSTISTWEVMWLVARGRLEFTMQPQDWIAKSESLPFLHFVAVDNAIAIRSTLLPDPFHRDPADRMIVATAMMMGVPVVTSDQRIRNYPHVNTVWT